MASLTRVVTAASSAGGTPNDASADAISGLHSATFDDGHAARRLDFHAICTSNPSRKSFVHLGDDCERAHDQLP